MFQESWDGGIEMCELRIDLERAIARLTPKQRLALSLWLQGYTQEEIGQRMGIAQKNVHMLLWRALERLKGIFSRDFEL